MSLSNMRDLLRDAEAGGYAVGAFSVANMECIRGVLAAAEECRAPIIMQIAESRLPHSPLWLIVIRSMIRLVHYFLYINLSPGGHFHGSAGELVFLFEIDARTFSSGRTGWTGAFGLAAAFFAAG